MNIDSNQSCESKDLASKYKCVRVLWNFKSLFIWGG